MAAFSSLFWTSGWHLTRAPSAPARAKKRDGIAFSAVACGNARERAPQPHRAAASRRSACRPEPQNSRGAKPRPPRGRGRRSGAGGGAGRFPVRAGGPCCLRTPRLQTYVADLRGRLNRWPMLPPNSAPADLRGRPAWQADVAVASRAPSSKLLAQWSPAPLMPVLRPATAARRRQSALISRRGGGERLEEPCHTADPPPRRGRGGASPCPTATAPEIRAAPRSAGSAGRL